MQVASTYYIHIVVYENLKGQYFLTAVQDDKTLDDPLTEENSLGGWSGVQPADEQTQLIADKVN